MDYTLAVYNSPSMEELIYQSSLEILVKKKGYPVGLLYLRYDPGFAIRGVFIDKTLGHLLKIDLHGYILKCIHGRKIVDRIEDIYPERFIFIGDIGKRYYVIDTSFALPELCLYSDIVEYFSNSNDKIEMSYWGIFEDLREVVNVVHGGGILKQAVLADPETFLRKDGRVPKLLEALRQGGKKTFLMTNSEFHYSQEVMKHILGPGWKDYFDIIIVNASKPAFFSEGTTLREVEEESGLLRFTNVSHQNRYEKGKIYHGGSLDIFKRFTQTEGREILYVGDNINHDIVTSKANRCLWRTLLVVKELDRETEIWQSTKKYYRHLLNLEYLRTKKYAGMDAFTPEPADDERETLREKIHNCNFEFDSYFNPYFGSVFRSGSSESAYTSQVMKFADLYTSDATNLLHYPLFYYYNHLHKLYPHELEDEGKK